MSDSPHVFEVTDETFQAEVLDRSQSTPVIVDFWAEWCAPCRALGPVLEAAVEALGGQVVLAKANTEQAPMAASQCGVQSIPAVYAVRGGQIVDGFVGALSEEEIRQWLDRQLPSEAEQKLTQALNLVVSDPGKAEELLREAISLDGKLATAQIELARLLLDNDRNAEAAEQIEQLEERGFLEPEAQQIQSRLALQKGGAETDSIEDCREAVEQAPDDLNARLRLAKALAAEGECEEALEHALHVVEHDFSQLREESRELMVNIFRELPDDSELTGRYRRQLASALY